MALFLRVLGPRGGLGDRLPTTLGAKHRACSKPILHGPVGLPWEVGGGGGILYIYIYNICICCLNVFYGGLRASGLRGLCWGGVGGGWGGRGGWGVGGGNQKHQGTLLFNFLNPQNPGANSCLTGAVIEVPEDRPYRKTLSVSELSRLYTRKPCRSRSPSSSPVCRA